jgi:hypothetical protein
MDKLVFTVMEKTGLPEDKARAAVVAVIGYLKQQLPRDAARAIDSAVSGEAGEEKNADRKKRVTAIAATTAAVNVTVLPHH